MSFYIPFDFYTLNNDKAWLLGFIFADATISKINGQNVIRIFNIDQGLLEEIKYHFVIPYKVGKQVNKTTTVYFLRFANPHFVDSVESYGFQKDRTDLTIPRMSSVHTRRFIQGFLKGKASYFEEKESRNYGVKIIYRSNSFITEVAKYIAKTCNVKVANAHCRIIKNKTSCEIKYVGVESDKVHSFIESGLF
ncbi:hypothetical protein [Plebeiibacterium marinum]|uniref:Uncharacterized protein n=1 Tax=Plebeiibacterium marinum TaxID=2992111 RepID=A0AAE3SID5_9BACT|nr:hypothetical protein [Plebeiobacterium marinum]MCW3804338.1 hypothetical protein [Plebeiobacterium marinum]